MPMTTGVSIFIVISLAFLVVAAVTFLCASAVIFSRVAFSLAAALEISRSNIVLVANNEFLNYVAWALVVMGVVYFLSTLPRVDMALKFFCTILLSVVVVELVIMLLGSIIAAIAKTEFVFSTLYEILVKIVCTLFSLAYMLVGKKPHYDSPTNLIMYNLERGLASLLYGLAITFLFISISANWKLPGFILLLVLVISTIAAFIADIYLAGKDILGLESKEEVSMPK